MLIVRKAVAFRTSLVAATASSRRSRRLIGHSATRPRTRQPKSILRPPVWLEPPMLSTRYRDNQIPSEHAPAVRLHRRPRARRIAWAAASCLAVAVLAAAVIWYQGRTPLSQSRQTTTHAPPTVTSTERPRLSLVVLPFEKFGDDVSDHAVNAIVDDLITELSRYAGLRLTARSSAFTEQGQANRHKGRRSGLGGALCAGG